MKLLLFMLIFLFVIINFYKNKKNKKEYFHESDVHDKYLDRHAIERERYGKKITMSQSDKWMRCGVHWGNSKACTKKWKCKLKGKKEKNLGVTYNKMSEIYRKDDNSNKKVKNNKEFDAKPHLPNFKNKHNDLIKWQYPYIKNDNNTVKYDVQSQDPVEIPYQRYDTVDLECTCEDPGTFINDDDADRLIVGREIDHKECPPKNIKTYVQKPIKFVQKEFKLPKYKYWGKIVKKKKCKKNECGIKMNKYTMPTLWEEEENIQWKIDKKMIDEYLKHKYKK